MSIFPDVSFCRLLHCCIIKIVSYNYWIECSFNHLHHRCPPAASVDRISHHLVLHFWLLPFPKINFSEFPNSFAFALFSLVASRCPFLVNQHALLWYLLSALTSLCSFSRPEQTHEETKTNQITKTANHKSK